MRVLSIDGNEATIALSRDEIAIVQGALNETCNALEDWEFFTRTGVERPEMAVLLDRFSSLFDQFRDTAL